MNPTIIPSKWSIYDKQIIELFKKEGATRKGVARQILIDNGLELTDRDVDLLRNYIRRHYKKFTGGYKGVENATESMDVDLQNVKHLWMKDKGASLFIKNPDYVEPEERVLEDIDFTSIFKHRITPITHRPEKIKQTAILDRLVYTDVHVGMEVNKGGFALYEGVWDEVEMNRRLEIMVKHTLKYQKSNTLFINDLGDFCDGWNGETVRQGHSLPQNMDNQKCFDEGLKFKIRMIESLTLYYDRIICVNICDDNHSGAFGYVVNSAFKSYIELKFAGQVQVTNQRKFIDHYNINGITYILSHGKDGEALKFGFKPVLDPQQVTKIHNYIDEYSLHRKGSRIEFSKGDSHQYMIDNSTSKRFLYQNFPAFSPPSNWVKTNFSNSISGFVQFNYYQDGQKTTNDYIFD